MKINEKLHLVMPIYDENDAIRAWVHSTPISREVFEAHFLLISKTFSAIHSEGLGDIAGPRVAALIMRRIAARNKDDESMTSLTNEIRRLTNVSMKTPNGWEMIPFQEVVNNGSVSADDLAEVENALAFFIVVSAMHRKQVAAELLPGAAKLWGAQISLLDSSAYHVSLMKSIETDNTGEKPKAQASSVPY
jgi:hypothetical protein